MPEPSVRALICDLVGGDPEAREPQRPTVRQALARCRPGQVIAARRAQQKLCVVVLCDGRSYAVPDRCPHDGELLSNGFVDGDRLVCARHGWEFDLETGTCPMRRDVRLDIVPLRR